VAQPLRGPFHAKAHLAARHSAISSAASILALFKLTHYPRVGCDSRGRLTLAEWENRARSVRGLISLHPLRSSGLEVMSLRNTRLKSRQITPLVISKS